MPPWHLWHSTACTALSRSVVLEHAAGQADMDAESRALTPGLYPGWYAGEAPSTASPRGDGLWHLAPARRLLWHIAPRDTQYRRHIHRRGRRLRSAAWPDSRRQSEGSTRLRMSLRSTAVRDGCTAGGVDADGSPFGTRTSATASRLCYEPPLRAGQCFNLAAWCHCQLPECPRLGAPGTELAPPPELTWHGNQ